MSAIPQGIEYGFGQVDWSIANNSGIAGAAVAVLPALVSASASTATAVGGGQLYSFAQQQVIGATLGFYDVAAGSATGLLFSEQLTQPVPTYEAPGNSQFDSEFDFPSTSNNDIWSLDSVYGK